MQFSFGLDSKGVCETAPIYLILSFAIAVIIPNVVY